MKRAIFLLCLCTCLALSSVANAQTVGVSDLELRDGLYYELKSEAPYTGRVISSYVTGQIRLESFYKDGLKDGKETSWYKDGNIRRESEYKKGERHGEWTQWNASREPTFHRRYENGDPVF